jgi:hypothetical protein
MNNRSRKENLFQDLTGNNEGLDNEDYGYFNRRSNNGYNGAFRVNSSHYQRNYQGLTGNNEGLHNEGLHNEGLHNEGLHNEGLHNEGLHNEGLHINKEELTEDKYMDCNNILFRTKKEEQIILSDITKDIIAYVLNESKTKLKILNITTKKIVTYEKNHYIITKIKINPHNNNIIAFFTQEKFLQIISLNNNELIYSKKYAQLTSLVWSPNGNFIAFNDKNIINIYNIITKELSTINRKSIKHSSEILSIDWGFDINESINKIISCDKNTIILYDDNRNGKIIEPKLKIDNVNSNKLKWSPTVKYFLSYNKKNNIAQKFNDNLENEGQIELVSNLINNFQFIYDHTFYIFTNEYSNVLNSQDNLRFTKKIIHDTNIVNMMILNEDEIIYEIIYVMKNMILIKNIIFLKDMPNIDKLINIKETYKLGICLKTMYINKLFTDYKFFSLYILKNNLLQNFKFKDTFLKIIYYTNFFTVYNKINLLTYIDNIIKFLDSIVDDNEIDRYYEYNNKNRIKKLKYNTLGEAGLDRPNSYNNYLNNNQFLEKIEISNNRTKDKYKEKLKLIKDEKLFRKERILHIYTQFIKIILPYLYKQYNKNFNHYFSKIIRLNITRNNELKTIIDLIDKDSPIFSDLSINLKIEYVGEPGVNAGGLTREFFSQLGRQLNMHIELKNNVNMIQGEISSKLFRRIKRIPMLIKIHERNLHSLSNNTNETKNKKQELLIEINKLNKELANAEKSYKEFKKISIESLLDILNGSRREKKNEYNLLKKKYNELKEQHPEYNQINSKIETNILIESKSNNLKQIMENIKKANKELKIAEENFSNINKKYEIISTYNSQIKLLNDETKIVKVLALSKKNNQPIYFNDKAFSKKILHIVSLQYSKNIRKILINLLSNENSVLSKESLYKLSNSNNNNNALINEKYKEAKKILNNQLLNLKSEKNQIFNLNSNDYLNIKMKEKKIENDITELKFKSIYNKYESKVLEGDENENLSTNPLYITILKYIENRNYMDFIDFYISHFILVDVPMKLILNNLSFEHYGIPSSEIEFFINKIKLLLDSFNIEETKIFNEAISGSILLNNNYKIMFFNEHNNKLRLPIFHTCFYQMDIVNFRKLDESKYFDFDQHTQDLYNDINFLKSKSEFIDFLNQTIKSGYRMA